MGRDPACSGLGPYDGLSTRLPWSVLNQALLGPLCPNTVMVSRHRAEGPCCWNVPHAILNQPDLRVNGLRFQNFLVEDIIAICLSEMLSRKRRMMQHKRAGGQSGTSCTIRSPCLPRRHILQAPTHLENVGVHCTPATSLHAHLVNSVPCPCSSVSPGSC